jgi:ubiquinone/menaquinone biosynthesis C-methylase UbiE
MSFNDHFSDHASDYARFRPLYPQELFQYLVSIAPSNYLAWDCGTGNGQAANGLATVFDRVIATDASEQQLSNATPNPRVEYRTAPAEASSIDAHSVDVVTVAQALHWFDIPKFFAEAKRVIKPNGVIAVWSYELMNISPAIDRILHPFYTETVGPFWPEGRELVEQGYRTIEFPFEELPRPEFRMTAAWTMFDFIGYVRTWSATQRFIKSKNFDPVDQLANLLGAEWGPPFQQKAITWPLNIRVGIAS